MGNKDRQDEKPIYVVIETPKGSRNKYNYDKRHRAFMLGKVLPAGAEFPYDFGYIPDTLAEDGDPIDLLLIMEESAFPGCLVETRLIGVIEAEQTEDGKTTRNDRLIGVATKSPLHGEIKSIKDLDKRVLEEIEHFFVSYNAIAGKEFKPLDRKGPRPAMKLVEKGRRDAKRGG